MYGIDIHIYTGKSQKGWSREILEPVFSIYLTFTLSVIVKTKAENILVSAFVGCHVIEMLCRKISIVLA